MVFIYNTIPHIFNQKQINSQPGKVEVSVTRNLKELTPPNKKFLISLGFNLVKRKIQRRQLKRK